MSNPSLYRHLVGSLVYLTVTCPDISYAVHQVSQYLSALLLTHYAAVLCILRYLKGTLFHGLFYSAQSPLILHAFSDADWIGHPFTQLQKGLLHMSNLFHEYLCEPNGFSFDNFFSKLALSTSPSQTSDYVVMAMYGCGRYLAFCRSGDKSWTKIRPIFGASLSVYLMLFTITTNFIVLTLGEEFSPVTLEAQILL